MQVRDKVWVVTGGGNGIGRELVLALLARGALVSAADIRQEGLEETASLAKAGDRTATGNLPDEVIAAHGVVDGLIDNAGIIQPFVRFNDLGFDAIERVIAVNLYGTINMVKASFPTCSSVPKLTSPMCRAWAGSSPCPARPSTVPPRQR